MQPKMKESTVRIPSFDACVWFKLPVQRFTLPLLKWKIPKTKECSLFFLAIPSLNQPCLFHPNPFQVLKSQIQGWSVLVNFGQIIFFTKIWQNSGQSEFKAIKPNPSPKFSCLWEKEKIFAQRIQSSQKPQGSKRLAWRRTICKNLGQWLWLRRLPTQGRMQTPEEAAQSLKDTQEKTRWSKYNYPLESSSWARRRPQSSSNTRSLHSAPKPMIKGKNGSLKIRWRRSLAMMNFFSCHAFSFFEICCCDGASARDSQPATAAGQSLWISCKKNASWYASWSLVSKLM